MENIRFQALNNISGRNKINLEKSDQKISEYFGCNVFNDEAMRQYLHSTTYRKLKKVIKAGGVINADLADEVASGVKTWALSQGVTHYTHWFQPLTGSTAEKHDSFFTLDRDGKAIEDLEGTALAQQEPDASSFPHGGIRNTFEARGYTAWDPTSPAFIFEEHSGKTLCVPTVFVSYTGASLDYKAPLLKSMEVVEDAALNVCSYSHRDVTRVTPSLGMEQEYFLVDRDLFNARPDLVLTGRTLLGHAPARGQQLDDHYFGSINERVYTYMVDFEKEAHKLGIPLRTRHNEVAPGQFECAPLYQEINLAVDQNQLLMDIMETVARKHNLAVLFHEKPFKGLNGSGKHNNWSLATNTGINLLSPGKTPKNRLQFLSFFVCVIKAFYDNADIIRAAIASAGNDHRLGANEAPPAIMSVFIGETLNRVLDEIEQHRFKGNEKDTIEVMQHGIKNLPEILLDNTDRNRTSPMAFTGNKFELRAVGSAANSSFVMTILNVAVAKQLQDFKKDVDALLAEGNSRNSSVLSVIRDYIIKSKNIRFEGNGYGDAWKKEAKKRGLSNFTNTPEALGALISKKAVELFKNTGIFTHQEIHARYEVMLENYTMKIQIESRVLYELVNTQIIPSASSYLNTLIENVKGLKDLGIKKPVYQVQVDLIERIASHIAKVRELSEGMLDARRKANDLKGSLKLAQSYCNEVKEKHFDLLRYHSDKLEQLVDDKKWTLPKYRELLFLR